jgi:hypothetical protein
MTSVGGGPMIFAAGGPAPRAFPDEGGRHAGVCADAVGGFAEVFLCKTRRLFRPSATNSSGGPRRRVSSRTLQSIRQRRGHHDLL